MSITPVDKPPDGIDEASQAAKGRSWSITGGVRRLVTFVADGLASLSQRLEVKERERDHERALTTVGAPPATLDVDATKCGSVEGFPDREHPLTYPGRNLSGINSPDVVSLETEDGLRLSIPENPDAELVSDVWMTVEP